MTLNKITIGLSMILRMLVRQKIVIILLLLIPAFFLTMVQITTSDRILPFQLASVGEEVFVNISEKAISFIFFAVASSGFLVAFLALNLVQKNNDVNRRLILCGYHPIELLISIGFQTDCTSSLLSALPNSINLLCSKVGSGSPQLLF